MRAWRRIHLIEPSAALLPRALAGTGVTEKEVLEYVAEAGRLCLEWFGPPRDPKRELAVATCSNSGSKWWGNRLLGQYYIAINDDLDWRPWLLYMLGSGACFRALSGGPRSGDPEWILPTIVSAASHNVMTSAGEADAAASVAGAFASLSEPPVTPSSGSTIETLCFSFDRRPRHYILDRLGLALLSLCPWDQLTGLATASSWRDWVAGLPAVTRSRMGRALLPGADSWHSTDAPSSNVAWAWRVLGYRDLAINECHRWLALRPSDAVVVTNLRGALNSRGDDASNAEANGLTAPEQTEHGATDAG